MLADRIRMRPSRRGLLLALSLVLAAAGEGEAHEPRRDAPTRQGATDPRQLFPFLVISGGGGHFHALLISPGLKTIFAGTHLGLFRSDDRSVNWRLAAPRFDGDDVRALARDPERGALYAATHRQGLLRSRDGGRRWKARNADLPGHDIHALALDPRNSRRIYAQVVRAGLFRTDDAGMSWRRVEGARRLPEVESVAVHPERPRRLYAGTAKGVWVSDNAGRTFRLPVGGLAHRTEAISVPPWAPDTVVAGTVEGAFMGKADGTGWTPLPPHPPWWGRMTAFAFLPEEPGIVFALSHQGVVAVLKLPAGEWIPLAQLPEEPSAEK